MLLNLDIDLKARLLREVDIYGATFAALPLVEQEKRLEPVLRLQRERDRVRLQAFCEESAA